MRFQLLDYCYGVSQRRQNPDADVMIAAVSEDERCEPFDSLFEQRVFNRVVDRGYSVIPQFSTDSYRIDMVIVGAQARLAVECDGDRWHGPAQYADDLARQRDLERAGWHFFRIRESAFYLDRAGTMRHLWQMRDSLRIYPSGRQPTLLQAPRTSRLLPLVIVPQRSRSLQKAPSTKPTWKRYTAAPPRLTRCRSVWRPSRGR